VVITNYPENAPTDLLEAINNPENPDDGTRHIPFSKVIYIEREDFMENPPNFYFEAHVGDYPLQLILNSKGYSYYIDEYMSAYRIGVEGSWTNRMFSGDDYKEKLMKIIEGDIQILSEYNRFTNDRYFSDIEKTILKKDLITIAASFKVHINKSDNKAKIIEKIVEATVGATLRSKAIRETTLKKLN